MRSRQRRLDFLLAFVRVIFAGRMKIHRSTSEAVIQCLESIFDGNRYADKVIEKVLKSNPKWGARDRRFIAETTYDIVRWYRLIQFVTRAENGDYWKLLGGWCVLHEVPLPGWDEFEGIIARDINTRSEQAKKERKIRESIPDWLDDLGVAELGGSWEKEITSLNEEAQVVLRTNTLKISRKELQELLKEENVPSHPLMGFNDALALDERQNVFGTTAFREGLFEVQDAASQFIAPFLQVEPGMRVIDACAGAGGKTLHLAALMKNKGRIISMDIEQYKLEELQKRARRAGVSNMETRLIESGKTIKRLENTADRLLLDVPCSGLGVLRRNPDAKWKLSMDFISKVKELQQNILQDYATMVKVGGMLVYSTCSLMPSENEKQVEQFLANHPGKFQLEDQKTALPSMGFDGFYMARLKRLS